jgi:hypothetical protein
VCLRADEEAGKAPASKLGAEEGRFFAVVLLCFDLYCKTQGSKGLEGHCRCRSVAHDQVFLGEAGKEIDDDGVGDDGGQGLVEIWERILIC